MDQPKTIGDFLKCIQETENSKAKGLIEDRIEEIRVEDADAAEECFANRFAEYCAEPLTQNSLLELRSHVSTLFADRLRGISGEALYSSYQTAHTAFIAEFDKKAKQWGFTIPRSADPITPTEFLAQMGQAMVNVVEGVPTGRPITTASQEDDNE